MNQSWLETDIFNDSKLKRVSCENCIGTVIASDSEVIGCRGTPNPGAVRRLGYCFQWVQQWTGKRFVDIISYHEAMGNPQPIQSEG